MKVLVSDNLGEIGIEMFEETEGLEVDVNTGLSPDELKAIIGDYDALVIRSATKVTADLLGAAKKLKVVGRAGIGLDNVDIPEATKQGVVVMNTPTGNVVTTAEHAVAMMLSMTRNIPRGTSTLKDGKWDKKKLQGREIFNKTMGVVGFGKIGSIVADRCRGLKMNVIIHDPHVTPEQIEKAGFECVSSDELFKRSDYISIHVPKLKDTIGFINKDAIDQMKDGVMLINCARGGIVNEKDLYDGLVSGKVAGAALDVFETEPPGDSPLLKMDNVIATPHLGASTKEAQTNVAVMVAEQIIDYLKNQTVKNAVNVPSVTGEILEKLGSYLFLGDRLGCLMSQLISSPIKEVNIEYKGEFKDMDMAPVSTAVLKGLLTPEVSDMVNFVNAHVIAKERGLKVIVTRSADAEDFLTLVSVSVVTANDEVNTVCGTIFGKNEPRVVRVNKFRLEMIPQGHLALIHNFDKPGAIGSIGAMLGKHDINIGRMTVGQEEDGDNNIIFLRTDTSVPDAVMEELRSLPLIKTAIPLEL